MHLRALIIVSFVAECILGGIQRVRTPCNLTGHWTYTPEPGHDYSWSESKDGDLLCFPGRDAWLRASGKIVGDNVTLKFADKSCPGASPSMPEIVKWGTIDETCSTITMHDVQPNCPTAGSCMYQRIPPPPPPCPTNASNPLDIDWLKCKSHRIINGSRIRILPTSILNRGLNATYAYTPDASHSYGAQWTRDFAYTVLGGAPDLMDEHEVKQSVRYTFRGQRASDGCMPDRVQIDGMSVMSPGGMMPNNGRNPQHDHAWDNGPFAAILLAATANAWPETTRKERGLQRPSLFCELEPSARRALDFVNRSSENHLVYNDINHPNCTYGFTDTVAKTGNLLFTSLLYIDASRQLAGLAALYGCGNATQYGTEAARMAAAIDDVMYDSASKLWVAATHDNRLPDVWGSAYLVALGLSTPSRRQAAMDAIATNADTYLAHGQLRHLPYPTFWTRCTWSPDEESIPSGCPAEGTYQNGAFWATPLSYLTKAMIATNNTPFARQVLEACVADFKANGIYEDVDYGRPAVSKGVLNYTASATNVLYAVKELLAHENAAGSR
eukprot:m.565514 g.565514  ORF g.565514 m.565514 type:complete len:555 (+) comp22245_c0_seq1:229-1893(+)